MKKQSSSLLKTAGSLPLLAALIVVEKFSQKIKVRGRQPNENTSVSNRKLTMLSIVYHAIGVFYNE